VCMCVCLRSRMSNLIILFLSVCLCLSVCRSLSYPVLSRHVMSSILINLLYCARLPPISSSLFFSYSRSRRCAPSPPRMYGARRLFGGPKNKGKESAQSYTGKVHTPSSSAASAEGRPDEGAEVRSAAVLSTSSSRC
jgi:hypothetical protein